MAESPELSEMQAPAETSAKEKIAIVARKARDYGVVDFTELGDFPEEFRPLVQEAIENLANAIGMACKIRESLVNRGETMWWVQVFEGRLESSFREKLRALTGAVKEIGRSAENKPRRERGSHQCRWETNGTVGASA